MSLFLNIQDIEEVCYEFAKKYLTFNEEIPEFQLRYKGKLEAALEIPQKSIGGKLMYKNLHEQAAVFFYEMIKLHPFLNGNKRIAVVSLNVFLILNGCELKTSNKMLYEVAMMVAKSQGSDRDQELKKLKIFIINNTKSIDLDKLAKKYLKNNKQ